MIVGVLSISRAGSNSRRYHRAPSRFHKVQQHNTQSPKHALTAHTPLPTLLVSAFCQAVALAPHSHPRTRILPSRNSNRDPWPILLCDFFQTRTFPLTGPIDCKMFCTCRRVASAKVPISLLATPLFALLPLAPYPPLVERMHHVARSFHSNERTACIISSCSVRCTSLPSPALEHLPTLPPCLICYYVVVQPARLEGEVQHVSGYNASCHL